MSTSDNSFGSYWHQAQSSWTAGDLEKTESLLHDIIFRFPCEFLPRLMLGAVFTRQGFVYDASLVYAEAGHSMTTEADAINLAAAYGQLSMLFLVDEHRPNLAVLLCKQAVRMLPNDFHLWRQLATAYWLNRDLESSAVANFMSLRLSKQRSQVELSSSEAQFDPDHAQGRLHLAKIALLWGNYEWGWREFEWRLLTGSHIPVAPYLHPLWDGNTLDGKSILLHGEQGLGDDLQFLRYAKLVKDRGAKTVGFLCRPELVELCSTCPGIDEIVSSDSDPKTYSRDCNIYLMSLPRVFGTTLTTIPDQVPYLFANPIRSQSWRDALGKLLLPGSFRVGIHWQGHRRPGMEYLDDTRSVPLELFEPLARIPGVELVSLQIAQGKEQLESARFRVLDCSTYLRSFADTAAAMANLDLVIGVDSAVCHCAGALGMPVWNLLAYAGCWRWLLDREDTPWYPTMRLFRQKTLGDWPEVFERVADELKKLVSSP